MKAKFLVVLLAVFAAMGTQSVFADWQIVNTPSPRGEDGGEVARKPAASEGEFLSLLDRAELGKKTPVDYKGRIQLLGGFGYWEDDSHGTWNYEKLVANMFGHGRHVYGFTAKHETYEGEKVSNPNYEFDGEGYFVGPSYEYRNFNIQRLGFTGLNIGGNVGYEFLKTNGRKADGKYFKDEESDVVVGEFAGYFHRGEGSLIKMVSVDGYYRYDAGSLMTRNSWDDDTSGNRTYREGRLRLHTRRLLGDTVSFNAGVKSSYEADRHLEWFGPVVGMTVLDSVYIDGEFLNGVSDAPYKWSVGASVDIIKFGRGVWRTVRGWFGSKDAGPVKNDWQLAR